MKKKKLYSFLLGIVLLSGGVLATWYLGYASGITGLSIASTSEGVVFSDDFTISNIDTTTNDFVKSELIYINNSNGELDYEITIVEIVTDVTNDTCDPSGDVSYDIDYEGISLSDGDEFTLVTGSSVLNVSLTAKQFSCPQDYELEVNLNPV